MNKLLSPGNVAVILLILTLWIPSLLLPEGTKLHIGIDNYDNNDKMSEFDPTTAEMPDIQKQSLREILDKWDCEIGFWDRSKSVEATFYNNKDYDATDVYGNPDYLWAEYRDMSITSLQYDEKTNTIHIKIKGDNDMDEYGIKNPKDDPAYFENHIRQILGRAFINYSAPIITQKGTAPYSWPITGAVVASALYNDCNIEIEYEFSVLKSKTPEWKGKMVYEGKNDLLDACDFSSFELLEYDKSLHFGDDWSIAMFMTP